MLRRYSGFSIILLMILALPACGINPNPTQSFAAHSSGGNSVGVQSKGGLQLTASANKETLHNDEPVVVKVAVKNIGSRPLQFVYEDLEREYKIVVKNSKGDIMPATRYGVSLSADKQAVGPLGLVSHNYQLVDLAPGKEFSTNLYVSGRYDMTLADTYSVTISRVFRELGDSIELTSNTVKIANIGLDRFSLERESFVRQGDETPPTDSTVDSRPITDPTIPKDQKLEEISPNSSGGATEQQNGKKP